MILATESKTFSDLTNLKIPLVTGNTGYQWTRLREADTTKNIDVLILGSSLAQSIDIRRFEQFNLRAFNLASGSQSPIQTRFLLDKYLESFNPKLVIWDFHPYTFSNFGVESTIDIISNCNDCSGMLQMAIQSESRLALDTYFKRMMLRPFENPDFKEPLHREVVRYFTGGYMETYFEAPEKEIEVGEFNYHGLELQRKTFESELKGLSEKGIKVLLVYSPKTSVFNQSFKNKKEWFDYSQHLVEQGLAEDFLDFNQLIPGFESNKKYFIDIAHLTSEGEKAYNNEFFRVLSKRFSNPSEIQ